MKVRKINRIVQTWLIAVLLVLLIGTIFEEAFLMWVILLYTMIGMVQYLTGWILRSKDPQDKGINRYLVLATFALALAFIVNNLPNEIPYINPAKPVTLFIFPWTAAIYFWYRTFRDVVKAFLKR